MISSVCVFRCVWISEIKQGPLFTQQLTFKRHFSFHSSLPRSNSLPFLLILGNVHFERATNKRVETVSSMTKFDKGMSSQKCLSLDDLVHMPDGRRIRQQHA